MSRFYISVGEGLFKPQVVEVDGDTVSWYNEDGLVEHADQNGVSELFRTALIPVPFEMNIDLDRAARVALNSALGKTASGDRIIADYHGLLLVKSKSGSYGVRRGRSPAAVWYTRRERHLAFLYFRNEMKWIDSQGGF